MSFWNFRLGKEGWKTYSYQLTTVDPDGDILGYELLQGPDGMTISDSGLLEWSPSSNAHGVYPVHVRVQDPDGLSDDQSFLLRVDRNDPPIVDLESTSYSIHGSLPLDLRINGVVSDDGLPSEGTLSIRWLQVDGPTLGLMLDAGDGKLDLSFVEPGNYQFVIEASDGWETVKENVWIRVGSPSVGQSIWDKTASHWTGDSTLEDSISDRDLIPSNTTSFAEGYIGDALALDGTYSSYHVDFDAEDEEVFRSGVSFDLWVRSPDQYPLKTLLQFRDELGMRYELQIGDFGGYIRSVTFSASESGSVQSFSSDRRFWANAWHHYAVTINFDDSELTIYHRGEIVLKENVSGLSFQGIKRMDIGANSDFSRELVGLIDDVGLYSGVLTGADVREIYRAGSRGKGLRLENRPPEIRVAGGLAASLGVPFELEATVLDDGQPRDVPLSVDWKFLYGPASVEPIALGGSRAEVLFEAAGKYGFEVSVSDGHYETKKGVDVEVETNCLVEPDAGLHAWWAFDERLTDTMAEIPMIAIGGMTFADGKNGRSFWFDGVDDYLATDLSLSQSPTSTGFAIEFWALFGDRQYPPMTLFELNFGGDEFLRLRTGDIYGQIRGVVIEYAKGSEVLVLPALRLMSSNSVHHYAVSYDALTKEVSLYRNGVHYGSLALPEANFGSQVRLKVGAPSQGDYYYDGRIDDLRVYENSLPQQYLESVFTAGSNGICVPQVNTQPAVFAGADASVQLPSALQLIGSFLDDGLGAEEYSVEWTQLAGPASATIVGSDQLEATATFSMPGIYRLSLSVSDSGFEVFDELTVNVLPPPNSVPFVDAGPDAVGFVGVPIPLYGAASDDGLPMGASFVTTWNILGGQSTEGRFVDSHAAETQAIFDTPGLYHLQLVASDGTLSATDETSILVRSVPYIEITSPSDGADLYSQMSYSVIMHAESRPAGVSSVEMFLNGVSVGQASSADGVNWSIRIDGRPEGIYELKAVAVDAGGETITDSILIEFTSVSTPPTAELVNPVEGESYPGTINVVGTARSEALQSYLLEYKAANESEWHELAVGQHNVVTDSLGNLDTSRLLNGLYEMRLTVLDEAGVSVTSQASFAVDSDLKVGNLSLAFEDLNLPVSGVQIQAIRSYDSRDSESGDFGIGWNLALNSMRIQKNRPVGEAWIADQEVVTRPIIGETIRYKAETQGKNLVLLRLPDDSVQVFKAVTNPAYRDFTPLRDPRIVFEPLGDTLGTLEIVGDNQVWIDSFNGLIDLQSEAFAFDVFDPTLFRYTALDGTEYVIDEHLGLQSVTDRNGNTITIDNGGVAHSSGKSIVFARDAEGRIETITDPENQQLVYTYDEEGRLSTFTNRAEETFTFLYENPDFPNYLTEILDPENRSVLSSEFDAEGRLIGQTDANGGSYDFIHDIENFTETVVDRRGVTTVHTYNLDGDVVQSQVFDPDGTLVQTTAYEYDGRGNETKVTDSLGNVTERSYDDRDNLLSETQYFTGGDGSILEATTSYTYDSFGNPLSITDAMERGTAFEYDASGNLTSQTDALDNVTAFAYDASGNLESITDPLGNRTVFETSDEGFQTSSAVFDAEGLLMQYQTFDYDALGQQTHVYDYSIPEGATETAAAVLYRYTVTGYDGEGRVTSSRTYDAADAVLTQSDTTYDARGQVESQTDALGQTPFFEYDANGNRIATAVFSPDELELRRETWTYDAEGNQTSHTDPLGHVTTYEYDSLGRQTDVYFIGLVDETGADLDPADNTSMHTLYDEIGRVVATVDELDNATLFEYDDNCGCSGRRAKVTNAANETTRYAYDLNGNQTSVTDAKGHTTTFEYDVLNRLVKTIFHDDTFTETVYDALGRRVATIDQNGLRTDFVYDALGRLIEVQQPSPAPGEPRPLTRYRYDSFGNQIEQIDALDRSTKYEYDELGRRVKRILPELQEESYQYDALGKLIARTDFNGYTTSFEYDALYRLASEIADSQHPSLALINAPAEIEYGYDAVGNRTSSSVVNAFGDTIHATSLDYDTRGRLTSRSASAGSLAYTYDSAGNLVTTTSSNAGGIQNRYTYDALNRLESVNDDRIALPDSLTSYGYDGVGNLETVSYGNGLSHNYLYDTLNRLKDLEILNLQSEILNAYSYQLDAAGMRIGVAEAGGRSVSYEYDGLYRLTQETVSGAPSGSNGIVSYAYDAVGNRLSRAATGAIASVPSMENQDFGYDANDRLASDTYDANGNTTSSLDPSLEARGAVSDVYDFRNRLIRRVFGDGSVVSMVYDADGNRVGRLVLDAQSNQLRNTAYLVDLNNHTGYAQVVEEWENAGAGFALEVSYLYGHDLIAQTRPDADSSEPGAQTHWYVYDGHGSVVGLADATGAIPDSYEYDAFGVLLSRSETTENSYMYTGEQYDADLGMYFLRARYLNASSGRFHTMDSYEGRNGEPLTLHKHLYAHGNPVMNIDPSGMFTLADLQAALGARKTLEQSGRVRVVVARKKAVKILTCQVGVAYLKKQYKGDGLQGHHPIPKNVGGDPLQDLVFLPAETHRMFHWVLNVLLKGDPQFGGKGAWTSKENWSELTRTPAGRRLVYPFILQASKLMDRTCKLKGPASLQSFVRKNRKSFIYGGAK